MAERREFNSLCWLCGRDLEGVACVLTHPEVLFACWACYASGCREQGARMRRFYPVIIDHEDESWRASFPDFPRCAEVTHRDFHNCQRDAEYRLQHHIDGLIHLGQIPPSPTPLNSFINTGKTVCIVTVSMPMMGRV